MKTNKVKKLNINKYTISNLQLQSVKGGYHDSCTPDCKPSNFPNICTSQQEVRNIDNI